MATAGSALDDLRVLDLSQGIAGPLCARLLGDFGADVIKVEPRGGECGRRMPPFFQDDPDPEKSLFFLLLNLNKRGITLDLETPRGAEILEALARQADVVVESFAPGRLAALGLDHASPEREHPALVMTSITPFGQCGPYSRYAGDEIVAYATSGMMAISGTTDREPLKHGGFQAQYEAGLNGALATLFTLVLRDATGAGQHVDVSIQEVVASTLVANQPFYSFAGGVQGRRRPGGAMFGHVMPCRDGYFVSQAGDGPYSPYPAQATTQEATHGLAHVTGHRGDIPSKAGQSYVDFLACWACLTGVALALRHRHRTGQGAWIDVGMYQLGCATVGEYILDWLANRRAGERLGNRHPWYAPQGCYPCAGDDQWCVVSVRSDEEWAALCRVMERGDLARDVRLAASADRRARHDEIDALIGQWTRGLTKFEVMERLQGVGVPAGAVFDAMDVNLNPHLWARGFLETVEFPAERRMGKRVIMGRPWRLGNMPLGVRGPGPALGQHNGDVIHGILGYSAARCAELEQAGILGIRPRKPRIPSPISMDERVRQGRLAYHDPDFKKRLDIEDD